MCVWSVISMWPLDLRCLKPTTLYFLSSTPTPPLFLSPPFHLSFFYSHRVFSHSQLLASLHRSTHCKDPPTLSNPLDLTQLNYLSQRDEDGGGSRGLQGGREGVAHARMAACWAGGAFVWSVTKPMGQICPSGAPKRQLHLFIYSPTFGVHSSCSDTHQSGLTVRAWRAGWIIGWITHTEWEVWGGGQFSGNDK